MPLVVLLPLVLTAVVQADTSFETDLWPGEGRPVIESVASALELRSQATGSSAAVVRLSVAAGQRLTFDETRFRTIKPGRVQAVKATVVTGRRLGSRQTLTRADYYSATFPETTFTLSAGETIEYLQYRSEGTCFVRIAGVVVDAKACPWQDSERFRQISKPEVEWWIRLVRNGTPVGWLLLANHTAKVVDRIF